MVWYGWAGLGVLLVNQAMLPWGIEPFARWFTPIMWSAYILVADARVLRRDGTSLIHDRPAEAAFMTLASIPLWLVFEAYNLRLRNWAYFGVPETPAVAALAYAWSFATIWPALFETAALLGARWPADRATSRRVPAPRPARLRTAIVVGLAFLAVPPLLPAAVRPWTFGFVWLGFVLLLDPLNYRAGRPSFLEAWIRGDRAFVHRWLLGGLLCGVLWEFWNYWALARWRYVGVPVFPEWKLFEMPIAGYLGFPPFALEAFTMYHFVRLARLDLARVGGPPDDSKTTRKGGGHNDRGDQAWEDGRSEACEGRGRQARRGPGGEGEG